MILLEKEQKDELVREHQGLEEANQTLAQSRQQCEALSRDVVVRDQQLADLEGKVKALEDNNSELAKANFYLNNRVKELDEANQSQGDKITALAAKLKDCVPRDECVLRSELPRWIKASLLSFIQSEGIVDMINDVMVPIEEIGMERLAIELCQRSDVPPTMLEALESHIQGKKLQTKAACYLRDALKKGEEDFPFISSLSESLGKLQAPEEVEKLQLDRAEVLQQDIPDWEAISKSSLTDLNISTSAIANTPAAEKPVAPEDSADSEETEEGEASLKK